MFRVPMQSAGRMSYQKRKREAGCWSRFPVENLVRWRWWSPPSCLFGPLSNQADVIDARGANLIHNLDHIAILGATVALDEHGLVQLVGDTVPNLIGYLRNIRLGAAEINVPARGDADDDRVILVGIGHVGGIVDLGQLHRQAL